MGALAEGFMAYAQPLIDATDGSQEQLSRAVSITQVCYNAALLPENEREAYLKEVRSCTDMSDSEFDEFRRAIVIPMIERHEEMFPRMHQRASTESLVSALLPEAPAEPPEPAKAPPAIDRYAPCPCGSGEKYKFCCSKKGR